MEPQSPSKSKLSVVGFVKSHRIVKFCLILMPILLVSAGIIYGFDLIGERQLFYTVVVDCGSTGTRVNVYEWGRSSGGDGDLPILLHSYPDELMKSHVWKNGCQYHCVQTEPGLDKFVGNYSGVKAAVEPLIHWAEGLVPRDRRKDTPIFVLATAGLRRIPVEEGRVVLEDVERVVKEHSFKWRSDWIGVLSGRDEAYYGWVALNYKMGFLKNASRLLTLGLLDLGGSSLQVVMETDEEKQDSHLLVSKIGPVEHQLLAYSLPAFGLNKAFDRTVDMLTQLDFREIDGGSEVKHPCLGSRFVGNYSCNNCSGSDSVLHWVGDPNWEKCKILSRAAATNSSISNWSETKFSSCRSNLLSEGKNVLNVAINTNPGVRYHALSGFFAVYNMLNLTAQANLTNIWEQAQHLCSSTWDGLSDISSGKYCFKVVYLASLIEDGLCLGNADIIFGPGDISWTLGASLVKGEHIWRTATGPRIHVATPEYMKVLSSPIFLFIILVLLLYIVYYSQIKLPLTRKRSVVAASLPSYPHSKHRPH